MKNGKTATEFFNYTKGVRQGCPLSPILFNLYVNDIFEQINQGTNNDVVIDENEIVNALMYADDMILISHSKEGLQNQIDILNEYCVKWNLEINTKKTEVMIFNRGNKLLKGNIHINNVPLEDVKSFKYLGFTISAKNCSFSKTLDDLSIKANRAIFALNNKFKISKLPIRLALKIFQAQIIPILLYGSEVWAPYENFDFINWDKTKIE